MCGAPLVNGTGLDRALMPSIDIGEQPTCLKLGLHLPGKRIPIVENSRLIEEQQFSFWPRGRDEEAWCRVPARA